MLQFGREDDVNGLLDGLSEDMMDAQVVRLRSSKAYIIRHDKLKLAI